MDPSAKHANGTKDLGLTWEPYLVSDDDADDCGVEDEEDELGWGKPSVEEDRFSLFNG